MAESEWVDVPAGRVPVAGAFDVVVCGGGPAGIAAAVAAARGGAATLLIEQISYLGGMASAAFVNAWCDTQSGPLAAELEKRLTNLDACTRTYNPESHLCAVGRSRFDAGMMAAVSLRMVREAGCEVLFCTVAEGAWLQDGQVAGVFIANKGGRSLIQAQVVIDTTADADIAASAGAEIMQGDPNDGRIQHVNFRYGLAGVDSATAAAAKLDEGTLLARIRHAHREGTLHAPRGVFRPCAETFPYHLPAGVLVPNGWEIEKVDPADPKSVSDCLADCQLAALEVIEFCREHVPGYEKCRIERFPSLLGTRESRRVLGRYVLCQEDIVGAHKFDDGIARACFFVDLHDSPPGLTVPFPMEYKKATMPPPGDWYEIPFRCLVPRGVKGLLVAGRCISCDRSAQGSMRLQPTCMYLGEAAGVAAAMAVADSVLPHQVDGCRVRRTVLDKELRGEG